VGRQWIAVALLGAASAAASAQQAQRDFSWGVSAGLQYRTLVERADEGGRLVEETGPMLRLGVDGRLALRGGGALQLDAGIAGGVIDYDGQTQAGVPHTTETAHRDFDLTARWRPWAPSSWGEAWVVLRGLQQRREIHSTPMVAGLLETSTLLMPGIRWSHEFDAAPWKVKPSVEVRSSVYHRLEIDFGGLFDASDIDGGHRNELEIALEGSSPQSPWSWSVGWTHARQSASNRQALLRGGVVVGTVRQPRIEIDDLTLRVRRAF
jgi:hypothetical protein